MPATQPLVERCGFLRKPQLQNRLHCRRNRHWLLSISHIRLANLMADPLGLHQVVNVQESKVPPRPSRPGDLHPEPLTDPDMTLSRHPARAVRERLSPFIQVGGFLPLPVDPTWIGPPTPFAPLRLQQLRHYCEVVRP
jgi:hypothetical protein